MSSSQPEKKFKASPAQLKLVGMFLDKNRPLEKRLEMLFTVFHGSGVEEMQQLMSLVLQHASSSSSEAEAEEKKAEYAQKLHELEQGGVRPATLIGVVSGDLPGPSPRAHVVSPDGQERFPFLPDTIDPASLRRGQSVLLDAQGAVLLGVANMNRVAGAEAVFQRRLPDSDEVEISVREERFAFYASVQVLAAYENNELKRGDSLLICPQQQFAFQVIPGDHDRQHRFVDRNKLPNVDPQRDIGNPHVCLGWLLKRTRILMFRPDLQERYELRPRVSLLMTGPSGTGKTLTIKAYLTCFGKMLVERSGRDDLGSRVVRVKMSEQLSEWLGRSDKNFDALFDDIQALAAEPVETADGQLVLLPVVVIFEEVEGVARRRSMGDHDGSGGAMDRILGTLLQRLDDPLDELSALPLVIISTSNRPTMIDVAMQRRLGARVARFKRLDREGLAAVLDKKVGSNYPLAKSNGTPQAQLRQDLIDEVVADLFDPRNNPTARLELTLGDGTKLDKYPRDFLSGALVEQALSEAIDQLTFYAADTGDDVGLDSACLIDALRGQIEPLIENVTAHNAVDYVDLPDHSRVANVRRLAATNGHLHEVVVSREV